MDGFDIKDENVKIRALLNKGPLQVSKTKVLPSGEMCVRNPRLCYVATPVRWSPEAGVSIGDIPERMAVKLVEVEAARAFHSRIDSYNVSCGPQNLRNCHLD
eukprot:g44199.t1